MFSSPPFVAHPSARHDGGTLLGGSEILWISDLWDFMNLHEWERAFSMARWGEDSRERNSAACGIIILLTLSRKSVLTNIHEHFTTLRTKIKHSQAPYHNFTSIYIRVYSWKRTSSQTSDNTFSHNSRSIFSSHAEL